MAENYVSYVLTNAGRSMMARIIAGTVITFKRMAVGSGYLYNQDKYLEQTALVNEVLSIDQLEMEIDSNNKDVIRLQGKFSTSQLTQSFWYREFGIFIVDPDDETKEILFAYGNQNDKAEYLTPHVDNKQIEKTLDCKISVGESANVRIFINVDETLNVIEFAADEWTYNDTLGVYVFDSGQVNRVGVNVFKKSELGRVSVEFVDIITNPGETLKLHALEAFDGYLIFA